MLCYRGFRGTGRSRSTHFRGHFLSKRQPAGLISVKPERSFFKQNPDPHSSFPRPLYPSEIPTSDRFFSRLRSPFAYPRAFLIILFRVAAGSRSSIMSVCSISETDLKYHSVRVTHNGIRRELSTLPAILPYWAPS